MAELPKDPTEREKLFDRIMKLHKKAQSLMAMGPQHEAEAMTFLAGVQQMLETYKLEMSDIEYAAQQKSNPVKYHGVNMDKYGLGKKRAPAWHQLIIIACAKAHFCHPIFIGNTNHFLLIGRREDRQVCEFMIITLIRMADAMADKAYTAHFYQMKDEGDVTVARGYRKSWITGFTHRIVMRYDEILTTRERELQKGDGKSLIRINQETALVRQVADEVGDALGGTDEQEAGTEMPKNLDGYGDGHRAAKNVNLKSTGLAAGKETNERALGQGQKLLGAGNGE